MSSQSPSDETLAKDPKLSSNLIAIKIIYEKLRSDLVGIGGTTTVKNEITSIINNLQYAIMHPYFNGVQLLRASAYKQAKKKLPLMQEKVNTIIRLWDEETVPLELEVTAMVNDIDDSLDKYGIKGNERLQFNHQINAAMMNNSWGEANDLEQFKISAEKVKKDLAKIQSEINKIYGNPKRKSKSVSKSNKSKSKSKSKSNSKSKRISNSKSKSKSKSKSLTKLFSGSISKKVSPAKMDSFKDLYNYNPQTLRQWKPCRGDQERNYKSSRCKKFKFHCPPGQGHSRSNDKCVTLAQYLVYLSKKYKELHKADKLKRKSTKRRKSGSLKRKSGSRKRKSVKRKSKKRKSVSKRKSSSHKSKSRSSSHKKSRSSSHKRKSSSHKSPKPTGRAMRARKPVKYF